MSDTAYWVFMLTVLIPLVLTASAWGIAYGWVLGCGTAAINTHRMMMEESKKDPVLKARLEQDK